MGDVFPKYHELICDTYSPLFTASSQRTLMPQGDATRSRLVAGGSFFRSVDIAAEYNVNSIILQCIVTPLIDDEESVEFKITDENGVVDTLQFTQQYDTDTDMCESNGVTQLRALLATNPIVVMPLSDIQQPWEAIDDDSECLLSSFGPTNMSGGVSLPTNINAIRTGPAYTLYLVVNSEKDELEGMLVEVNEIFEWDGTQWLLYPTTLYDPDTPPPCP